MKIFGALLATFALSLSFAFAQTTTTATTNTDKKACTAGEAKAGCCAGKTEKAACCKEGAKGHADAIDTRDARPVSVVSEEATETRPGANRRRVVPKSNKNVSTKPQAAKQ